MIVNEGIPAVEQLSLMTGVYAAIAVVVVLVEGPRFVRLPAPQDAAHARQETGGPIDGAVAATTSIRDLDEPPLHRNDDTSTWLTHSLVKGHGFLPAGGQ